MSGLIGWLSRRGPKPEKTSRSSVPSPKQFAEEASTALFTPSLEARNIVRGFGQGETRTIAVKNVSMRLFPGELSLLMGPSGSGKSTLLANISGLLHPDEGRVFALGQDIWQLSSIEMERFRLKHCSYIFQGCNLFPALTARQQVEMVLRWGEGVSAREARERADAMLAHLGLAKKGHLRPSQMSGGEKQRCAIARAMVKEPSFMFADEPTSALDWENGQQVIELLHKAAHDRGAMVLVVTHDSRLIDYADRVFHMEDGELTSSEMPKLKRERETSHSILQMPKAVGHRLSMQTLLQEATA